MEMKKMLKLVDREYNEISGLFPNNFSLDNAISAVGQIFPENENENVLIDGKWFFYDDLDLIEDLPIVRTEKEIEKLFNVMRSEMFVMSEYGDNENALKYELFTCDNDIFNDYLEFYEIKKGV